MTREEALEPKFKVGDWVTISGILPDDIFKLTENEITYGEILLAHFKFTKDEWKPWVPKINQWCWCGFELVEVIDTATSLKICRQQSDSYEEVSVTMLEPFIGSLPSFVKDK